MVRLNIAYYWRKSALAQESCIVKQILSIALSLLALAAVPARAVTPDAEAFMAAVQKLAPVLCERRKLRRELVMARVEQDAARERRLRERLQAIARDPETARLDERIEQLHRGLLDSNGRVRDPDDLRVLSAQQLELFARCE